MEGETKIKDEPPDPDPDPISFGYNLEENSPTIKADLPLDLPLDTFQKHPWLQNSNAGTLYCGPCSQHFAQVVAFTLNVGSEGLAVHEEDPSHREAVTWMSAEPDPNTGKRSAARRYELNKRKRKFCTHWLLQYPWLYYDEECNRMFCK